MFVVHEKSHDKKALISNETIRHPITSAWQHKATDVLRNINWYDSVHCHRCAQEYQLIWQRSLPQMCSGISTDMTAFIAMGCAQEYQLIWQRSLPWDVLRYINWYESVHYRHRKSAPSLFDEHRTTMGGRWPLKQANWPHQATFQERTSLNSCSIKGFWKTPFF